MTTGGSVVAQLAQANHMRGWDGGWMWLWGTLMMLTWVVVVGVAVWLVLRSSRSQRDTSRARQILDERFARGELSVEEYEQRRDAMN
jgi:putative membrane protein